jgi:hypothetical protein
MPVSTSTVEQSNNYWRALGELIDVFSKIESEMQALIWQETKVPADMAKAIFSGFRIDQAKDLINRAREANGRPEDERLRRAFAQLTLITKARNDIVHYGAKFDGQAFSVSNEIAAHVPNRHRKFEVSPTVLHAMITDLWTINCALGAYKFWLAIQEYGPDGMPNVVRAIPVLQEYADEPWQYKPPPERQPKKRPPPRSPKR